VATGDLRERIVEAAFGSGERGGEGKGEGRSGRGEGKNKWWWQQDKFGVTRHHVREQNKNGCCFSGEGCGAVTFYSTRENIVHRYSWPAFPHGKSFLFHLA
jgi:hypothetical protein